MIRPQRLAALTAAVLLALPSSGALANACVDKAIGMGTLLTGERAQDMAETMRTLTGEHKDRMDKLQKEFDDDGLILHGVYLIRSETIITTIGSYAMGPEGLVEVSRLDPTSAEVQQMMATRMCPADAVECHISRPDGAPPRFLAEGLVPKPYGEMAMYTQMVLLPPDDSLTVSVIAPEPLLEDALWSDVLLSVETMIDAVVHCDGLREPPLE